MHIRKSLLKDSFFDDINGYSLDIYQRKIIVDNSTYLLVIAGAGSGKTLTIIGKIKYMIEKMGYFPNEILCISFTNETVNNLKEKVGYDVDCFTFHKLSLVILNDWQCHYSIMEDDWLDYIVDEFFESIVYEKKLTPYVLDYYQDYFENDITYKVFKKNYVNLFNSYKQMIKSFIRKVKTNGHNICHFKEYLIKNKLSSNSEANKSFLIVAFNVLNVYQEELRSTLKIDFDDMITLASSKVQKRGMKRKYRYIIIDEFQDTSWIRYDLIKNIIEKTHAKLMCVGDDYQSIYGFSGCNLDLFVHFKRYFNGAKIMHIKNTYRNSYEIINTSCNFIRKNKYQLKKHLYAQFFLSQAINIVYYQNDNYQIIFYQVLEYLYNKGKKQVLVLGRYNHDLLSLMQEKSKSKIIYKDMEINFLTVHRSKGLEEENVIVLNVCDDFLGFPSQIPDNFFDELISPTKEKILYAEERRLFYVALTRTKERVFLLVPTKNPSPFVLEIKKNSHELIVK